MSTRVLLTLIMTAFAALAIDAREAAGQAATTPGPRGLVSVSGGWHAPSRTFSDSFTFERYQEDATVRTDYAVQSGPFFDGGLALRLWGQVGVGAAFSWFGDTGPATIEGTIPHPFFFNRPRAIAGEVPDVKQIEMAVHTQVVAMLPAGPRALIVLSGGPSFFSVEQSVVTGVAYNESYPFDEATYRSATVRRERGNKVGFNAGADVVVMLTDSVGVGGLIRFTQATVDLALDDRTLKVDAGGLQAGGGIRLVF